MLRLSALALLLVLNLTASANAQTKPAPNPATQAPSAAPAAPVKETKQTIGDWVVACAQKEGAAKSCALSQTLMQTQTRKLLASLSIGRDAAGKVMANLTAPLGFAINKGGTLTIGTNPLKIEFITCLANGCLSIFEISGPLLSQLQAASKLQLTLESLQQKPVNIEFSMNGFPKAFAAYYQEMKI
jgi:invasion protein IalB